MNQPGHSFARMLASTPSFPDIPKAQVQIVLAMRVAVMAHRSNKCIKPYLAEQLGERQAADRFAHVMEIMGDCWPEPIMVYPPCCARTTYDEMLLLDLVTATVRQEAKHFHELLREMIPERERMRLHGALDRFVSPYRKAPAF